MFIVASRYGVDGVSPRTTHITSQNSDCFIDHGGFCFSQRRDYLYISHSNKGRSYYSLYQIQYKRFSSGSDCRCGASPSLPTSLIKLILGDTGMMWCLGHLRIIANNILW